MPTLVLWAGADPALSQQLLKGIGDAVAAPQVHVLDGCSHWIPQDRCVPQPFGPGRHRALHDTSARCPLVELTDQRLPAAFINRSGYVVTLRITWCPAMRDAAGCATEAEGNLVVSDSMRSTSPAHASRGPDNRI